MLSSVNGRYQSSFKVSVSLQGRRKGGSRGLDDPPFLGANFIHFLYKVLGLRSVQKKAFKN